MKSLPMIWHHVVNVKYTVKILSICVAFLETWTLTTQCIYILFSLCKVEVEIWRVLLKGNSWYLESGRNVHTMVFHNRTNTFWSCFQYLYDFRRILMLKLRIIFRIIRALIIFFRVSLVNSPEYSQLQSHPCLVKPYAFLQNSAGSDFSHMVWLESCKWLLSCEENCMDKLKAANNFHSLCAAYSSP